MKQNKLYTLGAAAVALLFAAGIAVAQLPLTPTQGVQLVDCPNFGAGTNFNALSVPYTAAPAAYGEITDVATGNSLTAEIRVVVGNQDVPAGTLDGAGYLLICDGPLEGCVYKIETHTELLKAFDDGGVAGDTSATFTVDATPAVDLIQISGTPTLEGAQFAVIPNWTPGALFGTTLAEVQGAGLTAGTTSGNSDILIGADCDGNIVRVYFQNSQIFGVGWRFVGDPFATATNADLGMGLTGLILQRAGSDPNGADPNPVLVQGVALDTDIAACIGNNFTFYTYTGETVTLDNSGLAGVLVSGSGSGNSDIFGVVRSGALTRYYDQTSGVFGNGFREVGDPFADRGADTLEPGDVILFDRLDGGSGNDYKLLEVLVRFPEPKVVMAP